MKHLKLFNDTASYETWKNSEDYVLPNVSYTEDGNLYYNAYVAPASPNIVVTYNVPDGDYLGRQVCGNYAGNNITTMIVDGVEMDFEYSGVFETYGKHTIEFVLDDKTTMPRGMFIDNPAINWIEKIELPATLTNYTFNIKCNVSTVKEIIFNSKTAPSSVTWKNVDYDSHVDCVIKYPKGSDYSSVINTLPNRYTAVEF